MVKMRKTEVPMTEAKGRDEAVAEETKRVAETTIRIYGDVGRQTTDRLTEQARESMRQWSATSAVGADTVLRTGLSLADGAHEIASAWARYAEEVMRQTSEASRVLIGCHSFAR
jgi:hypothetical protein